MQRSNSPRTGGLLALALTLAAGSTASVCAQSADIVFRAVEASGTECASPGSSPATCDWYLENDGGIVLYRTPQDVKWEAYISDYADVGDVVPGAVRAYQLRVSCASLDNGTVPLEPINMGCGGGAIPSGTFCIDIDTTRPDWLMANVMGGSIPVCNTSNMCPTEDPGTLLCGGLSLGSSAPAPPAGSEYYAATFSATVPEGALGVYHVTPWCNDLGTFLRDPNADPILPLEFGAMRLEVSTGRCCGPNEFALRCADGVTYDECQDAGGTFLQGQVCTGSDGDMDGLDNSCDICSTHADCDDGLFCTGTSLCFGGQCITQSMPCTRRYETCNEATDSCECSGICDVAGDGDFNSNDTINLTDHDALVDCLDAGLSYPEGSCCFLLDLNGDGFVDLIDVAEFQNAFMTSP